MLAKKKEKNEQKKVGRFLVIRKYAGCFGLCKFYCWQQVVRIKLMEFFAGDAALERFRAGHFTCKITDWEKWREPIRKVEPETMDWALHTRIPVRIEPSHFLTAAECCWVGRKILKEAKWVFLLQRFFFFVVVSGRWPDLWVFLRLQMCFQFIHLFVFIRLPCRRRRPLRRCHRLLPVKTLCLRRNCFPRSRYIGCETPSFLPRVLRRHSQLQWNSVITYPQGKWKKVRSNQSTFYPKRDFRHWQDWFHVFTRAICHGRCFSVLIVVHYSLFVRWNRLLGHHELENVPGNWNRNWKAVDGMLVIRKQNQRKGKKVLLEGKLVRNIRFCAMFCTSYPKKMYMFSDWRCPWSTGRTL